MNDTQLKLEESLKDSLSSVLTENEERINELNDVMTVAAWYREAKQDPPNKIPSIIVNRIIEELLNHSKTYFINSITEHIEIQCQINTQQQEVKGALHINLGSIKPYIEFFKVIDGKEVPPALRITFKIDLDGTFEGLKIRSSPTISVGQGVSRKEISLDKFSFDLTISIIKLPAFNLVVPIYLYHKEQFKVENLHFYL